MASLQDIQKNAAEREIRARKSPAAYVKELGGKRVIEKVLVANNGISAVKAIRSMRAWAFHTFGDERAVRFVSMATPEDMKAGAEYIRLADQLEEVPGGTNNNNYANVELIVDIAVRTQCSAVWAGWGHASEFPTLPAALARANIAFMGPPSKAMHDLGDKIASTIIAQSAGVPCVPWSGAGLKIDYKKDGLPDDVFAKACVRTLAEAQEAMKTVQYPAMLKASEGGGGKGIRMVHKPEELESSLRQIQGEVPGSPVFLMRMVKNSRHLEVQVLADEHGQAICLYGRDCSVQRRHQKIIEEAPAIVAPRPVWLRMEAAAVRLAKAVGYVGAGTVEYLFTNQGVSGAEKKEAQPEDGEFYFLELNPRLQVEHPTTEQVTDVNLPAAQLNVAMGIPLHRIPDIRRMYGVLEYGTEPLDLEKKEPLEPRGHCIACRITGENPRQGFKPTSGSIAELTFRSSPNVWGYFSVGQDGGLHEFADSQFGHLFAHGNTREEARCNMVMALKEMSVRGDVHTPIEYLVSLIETDAFRSNRISTEWLDELIRSNGIPEQNPDPVVVAICGCVYKCRNLMVERQAEFERCLERGQIPPSHLLRAAHDVDFIYNGVSYRLHVQLSGPRGFLVSLRDASSNDQEDASFSAASPKDAAKEKTVRHVEAEFRVLGDDHSQRLLVMANQRCHVVEGLEEVIGLRLTVDGHTCMLTKEIDPTTIRTSSPGKLVRYLVEDGAHVIAGQQYAEIEVMKMYMPLIVSDAGRITFTQSEGAVLAAGDILARLTLDDPSSVKMSEPYLGPLPDWPSPRTSQRSLSGRFHEAQERLRCALAGYRPPRPVHELLGELLRVAASPRLPLNQTQTWLGILGSRLPQSLTEKWTRLCDDYERVLNGSRSLSSNTSNEDKKAIDAAVQAAADKAAAAQEEEKATSAGNKVTRLPVESAAGADSSVAFPRELFVASLREEILKLEAGQPRTSLVALVQPLLNELFPDINAELPSGALPMSPPLEASSYSPLDVPPELDLSGEEQETGKGNSDAKTTPVLKVQSVDDINAELGLPLCAGAGRWTGAARQRAALLDLAHRYLSTELLFQNRNREEALQALREQAGDTGSGAERWAPVVAAAFAMNSNSVKTELMLALLSLVEDMLLVDDSPSPLRSPGPNRDLSRELLVGSAKTKVKLPPAAAAVAASLYPLLSESAEGSDGSQGNRVEAAELDALRITDSASPASGGSQQEPDSSDSSPSLSLSSSASEPRAISRWCLPLLQRLAVLNGLSNLEVSLKARRLLIRSQLPGFKQRRNAVMRALRRAVQKSPHRWQKKSGTSSTTSTQQHRPTGNTSSTSSTLTPVGYLESLQPLVCGLPPIFDLLVPSLGHHDPRMRGVSLEVYIRRAYRAYHVLSFNGIAKEESSASDSSQSDAAALVMLADWTYSLSSENEEGQGMPSAAAAAAAAVAAVSGTTQTVASGEKSQKSSSSDTTPLLGSLPLSESVDRNLHTMDGGGQVVRTGRALVVRSADDLEAALPKALSGFKPNHRQVKGEAINVMAVFILTPVCASVDLNAPEARVAEQRSAERLSQVLKPHVETLKQLGIRRVTVTVLAEEGRFPQHYTFRERLNYDEDAIFRHIEPPLAFHLELNRLQLYDIQLVPTVNRRIHLYYAEEHGVPASDPRRCRRLFARALVRQGDFKYDARVILSEVERVLVEAIKALEIATTRYGDAAVNNHIFLKVQPEALYQPEKIQRIITWLGDRYGKRLWKLRVSELELVIRVRTPHGGPALPVRFTVHNPTGYSWRVHGYLEVRNKMSAAETMLHHLPLPGATPGPLASCLVSEPYPPLSELQRRRYAARRSKTTYVYDFVDLFREALRIRWADFEEQAKLAAQSTDPLVLEAAKKATRAPGVLLEATELVLNEQGTALQESHRPAGHNDVGMVAWRLRIRTPECSDQGRELILIANDITHQIGSFGPREDQLFKLASELSRKEGLPRIYLAANSGARIGLAQEVKESYRVAWRDPEAPQKGFEYLYVDADTFQKLNGEAGVESVHAKPVSGAADRYELTDIIGKRDGLGVENLRGSGMIAGETSAAYQEVFTCTLVTGRTVGIGAYLVRLGQRTVQNEGPIILTGAPALNKVLGREVYSSNSQLGGPQIMYNNGVTHLSVHDELNGVSAILRWLSYVPERRGAVLPRLPTFDSPDREVDFTPGAAPYDPRHMLAGTQEDISGGSGASGENNPLPAAAAAAAEGTTARWISGFFDRGSFMETLGGWARTVVCGRARLGGVPVGVVAVETRTVEEVIPADPADLDSQQQVLQQPGQVWFPNSAFKTAQAIRDFNRGEELPLFIFANWRGFSGGMRDMFQEVLKFGADIVDALREYRRPVFVYIPPAGELRGGAWAVLDPTINPVQMEMYADRESRGGVLESSGTVSIKYRRRDLVATMLRLDSKLAALRAEQKACQDHACRRELAAKAHNREEELLPIYQQVAMKFADLHDTPGRMQAKGVVSGVLEWKQSRRFFYRRLLRRLAEENTCRAIQRLDNRISEAKALQLVRQWLSEMHIDHDDLAAEKYLQGGNVAAGDGPSISERLNQVGRVAMSHQVGQALANANVDDVASLLKTLPVHQLEAIRTALQQSNLDAGASKTTSGDASATEEAHKKAEKSEE